MVSEFLHPAFACSLGSPAGSTMSLVDFAPMRAYSFLLQVANHSMVSSTGCEVRKSPTGPFKR